MLSLLQIFDPLFEAPPSPARWTPLKTSSLCWLAGKSFSRTAEYLRYLRIAESNLTHQMTRIEVFKGVLMSSDKRGLPQASSFVTRMPTQDHMGCLGRGAYSSAGEHFVDIEGVTGSIPVTPTIKAPRETLGFLFCRRPILWTTRIEVFRGAHLVGFPRRRLLGRCLRISPRRSQ